MGITIKQIKDLYNQFDVKLQVVGDIYCGACANIKQRTIYLNKLNFYSKNKTDVYRVHLIFHELCHILCFDHKKFFHYHSMTHGKVKRDVIRLTGLKAERYCDKMADAFIKSLYPDFPLHKSYRTPQSKIWYHKQFLNKYWPKKNEKKKI